MVDRYEPRVCGSAGVFVFAIAIATCYFAKSITFLVVACGVVAGRSYSTINESDHCYSKYTST